MAPARVTAIRPWIGTATLVCASLALACDLPEIKRPIPPGPPGPGGEGPATSEIRDGFSPLLQATPLIDTDTQLAPDRYQAWLSHAQAMVAKHSQSTEGREAIRTVARALEESLRTVHTAGNVGYTLALADIIRVLDPQNPRLQRHVDWAMLRRNRPVVTIRGWFERMNTPVESIEVFLEVYLPASDEVRHMRVRPGEEFLDLQFRKIIGDKKGIVFYYVPTNELFEVYGP